MKAGFLKPTFWKIVAVLIISAGLTATYFRFTQGLSAVTNLSDQYPWGMWIGFDILCGVCLAAGGFLICAITHIFNIHEFKPLARPAILTAFLGYSMVVVALLFDLGRPLSIWHALIMWNPHSVMFEVAWCVMLYSTVLFLEFSPVLLERFKLQRLLKIIKKVSLPIMISGVLLSTLHQSSLGSLFLIVPSKMHPLWYSAMLPVHFYLSAIGAGFGMIIFEAYLSARAFGKGLEMTLLSKIGKYASWVIAVGLVVRFTDIIMQGKFNYLFQPTQETYMFWLEIVIGGVIPFAFLIQKNIRESRKWLYLSATTLICGILLNRLNVSITAINGFSSGNYFPSFSEVIITMMFVTIGIILFYYAVKFLPVFEEVHEESEMLEGIVPEKGISE
ncbi:MAG: Ni/Fe-hydrogenase cytochrome b subunit [Ignavibacteriales bacterium]|nr:Ni/Fe-hydrogenase cytochrome b subunit [Ignavibacteriales bacterium]